MSKSPTVHLRQPSTAELVAIIHAAATRNQRRGGPYRIGMQGACNVWHKRAKAQALHDHYRSKEAAARRRRLGIIRIAA